MPLSVVPFSFSRAAQPEAQGPSFRLSAGFLYHILSPTGLVPKLHRGSQGPLRPGVAFPTTSCLRCLWSPTHQGSQGPPPPGFLYHILSATLWTPTVWLPVLTELYNSSTPTQLPTQSLEWHVWSSSSGNNCHAVQRSLSSGASVYECIMGFLPCPISSVNFHLCKFFQLLAIGMCHFLPVHHFGMACLAGSKVKIQHFDQWNSGWNKCLMNSNKFWSKLTFHSLIISSLANTAFWTYLMWIVGNYK